MKTTKTNILDIKEGDVVQLTQQPYQYESMLIKEIRDEVDRIYLIGYSFQFMGQGLQWKYNTDKPYLIGSELFSVRTYSDESVLLWNNINIENNFITKS